MCRRRRGSRGAGAVSYAAAAGSERSSDPNLRFTLNGKRLAPTFTILQAVQQAKADQQQQEAAGSADGSSAAAVEAAAARRARRMWDEVYTLHYARWDGPDPVDTRKASTEARSISPVVANKKVTIPPTPRCHCGSYLQQGASSVAIHCLILAAPSALGEMHEARRILLWQRPALQPCRLRTPASIHCQAVPAPEP